MVSLFYDVFAYMEVIDLPFYHSLQVHPKDFHQPPA